MLGVLMVRGALLVGLSLAAALSQQTLEKRILGRLPAFTARVLVRVLLFLLLNDARLVSSGPGAERSATE